MFLKEFSWIKFSKTLTFLIIFIKIQEKDQVKDKLNFKNPKPNGAE